MSVAVDTNILLDVLLPDPQFKDASFELLSRHIKNSSLIICEIVYSELASQFNARHILDGFLNDAGIILVPSSPVCLWKASAAWKNYVKTRDQSLQCSNCGTKTRFICPECSGLVKSRQHIISDFIIGGHALINSKKLLTRDRGFYKTYFPSLVTN